MLNSEALKRSVFRVSATLLSAAAILTGCGKQDGVPKATVLRLGYFPNITHAQPLLGVPRGDYQRALAVGVTLEPHTFNAGPALIEALTGGSLDIAYVGPSPAINAFVRSNGNEVRVIAGAASNGVLVVGNKKRGITKLDQLKGKRVATPQVGNTQDISCRYYLAHDLGSKLKEQGGDTEVISLPNPDIEILFEKDQIDAAWIPEPWGSRSIEKGLGVLVAEEKDLWPSKTFALTNVIARREFLESHPDLVRKFLVAHVALTAELNGKTVAVSDLLNTELKRLTNKELPGKVIADALAHTQFTTDPAVESFTGFFEKGISLGLIKGDKLDVSTLIDTRLLLEVADGTRSVPATVVGKPSAVRSPQATGSLDSNSTSASIRGDSRSIAPAGRQ